MAPAKKTDDTKKNDEGSKDTSKVTDVAQRTEPSTDTPSTETTDAGGDPIPDAPKLGDAVSDENAPLPDEGDDTAALSDELRTKQAEAQDKVLDGEKTDVCPGCGIDGWDGEDRSASMHVGCPVCGRAAII